MEYIILGILIVITILVILLLTKGINEGHIVEKIGNIETNVVKELGEFKSNIERELNEDFTKEYDKLEYRLRLIND